MTDVDSDGDSLEKSTPNWFGLWVIYVVGSILGSAVAVLTIADYIVNKPEVVDSLGTFFGRWVKQPIVELIQYSAGIIDWSFFVDLIGPDWARIITSVITFSISIVVLYASALGLAKLYDLAGAVHSLRELAVFVLTVLLLPVGALAIVHIFQGYFHFSLPQGAQSLLDGYRSLVHPLIEAAYWLPIHLFHISVPSWLKDITTVSIISVGMSRKAVLGVEGISPGTWNLDWSDFWSWVSDTVEPGNWSWIRIVKVVPQLIGMFAAQIIGSIVLFLALGWRWLAERTASMTYVVVRGLLLLGLVFPIEHVLVLAGYEEAPKEYARASRMYALYSALTATFIIWFVFIWERGAV